MAPQLPGVPQNLTDCTDQAVPAIPGEAGTPLLKSDVAGVIGDQRTSALAGHKCASDWRSFYVDLRDRIGGKP